eukprot:3086038-Pyramimonas_sp.AAC.1
MCVRSVEFPGRWHEWLLDGARSRINSFQSILECFEISEILRAARSQSVPEPPDLRDSRIILTEYILILASRLQGRWHGRLP